MAEYSPIGRCVWGVGYMLAGVLFFFAIIGVFGLQTAIGSLVLFVFLALISLVRMPEQRS